MAFQCVLVRQRLRSPRGILVGSLQDNPVMHEPTPTIGAFETRSIDVTQHQTLEYWLDTLGVDEYQLRAAVAEVGTSAQDVRCHLGMP